MAAPATPESAGGAERPPAIVEAVGLAKRYGHAIAVADLDLTIRPVEIYGLLGPNGAGKSTTLGLLLGLVRPSAGQVRIDGLDVVQHPMETKRRIGTGCCSSPHSRTRVSRWSRATTGRELPRSGCRARRPWSPRASCSRRWHLCPAGCSSVGGSAALLLGVVSDLMLFVAGAGLLVSAKAPGAFDRPRAP